MPLPQEKPPPTTKLGQSTAITSTVLVVPNMAAKLMLIRYNILKLLVRSSDFWYSVAISTATCVLLAIYFNDARGVMVLIQWMGNLNGAVVDANTKRVRHSVIASTAGGIVNMHFVFFVQCQLIDAAKDFEVIRESSSPET
uniref:Uncharacterized protein n=1 Tax=Globisporangium ultimum (strain ATCC 200006 / CBS 805.95 / DAOM BR144) TaxID=431595 RepID=K3WWK6_GLOUD